MSTYPLYHACVHVFCLLLVIMQYYPPPLTIGYAEVFLLCLTSFQAHAKHTPTSAIDSLSALLFPSYAFNHCKDNFTMPITSFQTHTEKSYPTSISSYVFNNLPRCFNLIPDTLVEGISYLLFSIYIFNHCKGFYQSLNL